MLDHRLTKEQLQQRYLHAYHRPTSIPPRDDRQRHLFFLSRLWNIDRHILEYNFKRMMDVVEVLANHRTYHFGHQRNGGHLREEEDAIALEFYLQIDHDLFYMKTCTYRGAIPMLDEPSLICRHEPKVRYTVSPCNRVTCCLCHPCYKSTFRKDQCVLRFNCYDQHRFIHGYRSILNCPATCETQNIIYALTCPCHKVDYIGETNSSLPVRLSCQ